MKVRKEDITLEMIDAMLDNLSEANLDEKIKAYRTHRQLLFAYFKGGDDGDKDKIGEGNFAEVYFGDNDFGHLFEAACEFLWLSIRTNNSQHNIKESGSSMAKMIKWLDSTGQLVDAIERTVGLLNILRGVEDMTRGLHDSSEFCVLPELETQNITSGYFRPTIKFHKDNEFSSEWQNHEYLCWNLDTGNAHTY